ncbi:MAG: hypothetical protein AAFV77_09510 [Planctomycetota bacterium]
MSRRLGDRQALSDLLLEHLDSLGEPWSAADVYPLVRALLTADELRDFLLDSWVVGWLWEMRSQGRVCAAAPVCTAKICNWGVLDGR